jgi:hypothetical protein
VCTNSCEKAADCEGWASNAECVSSAPRVATGRCPASSSAAFCDLPCISDVDCAALDDSYECESGYCRVPGQSAAAGLDQSCEPTALAADDLIVIGDSLITLSIFTSELEAVAADAGGITLSQDEHLRDYASALTSMLAEGPLSLLNEYADSQQDGPARVVVMDGGATDMLQDACPSGPAPDCPAVVDAVRGAHLLLEQMAEGGVEHVVYFFHADPVDNPDLKAGLDVLRSLVENVRGHSPVACHWLDLRPVFEGQYADYVVGVDGIVFSDAGARASARAVWQLIEERCVAP